MRPRRVVVDLGSTPKEAPTRPPRARTPCPYTARTPRPLTPHQERLLEAVRANPGACCADLVTLLYTSGVSYRSRDNLSAAVKSLIKRGLIEKGVIREESRANGVGLYVVGEKLSQKKGYLGIYGWVEGNK